MATTKVDFINGAYSQLRISGLTVNPNPEELELSLDRLETMAAEWSDRNICCGYNFEDEPDPNSLTNVKRAYNQAFETNLAVRLVPDFNKILPEELKMQAVSSLANLSGSSAISRLQQVQPSRRQPRGSGNTLRADRWQRFYRPNSEAPNDCETNVINIGDVNDYVEHFDAYLDSGESISSYTITADSGLTIQSDSNETPDINYRIKAVDNSTVGAHQRVKIIVTTSEGRIETRLIDFDVQSPARIRT